jgi:hypothetical protein
MNWVWNYLTLRRGMRLITGVTGSHIEDMPQFVHRRIGEGSHPMPSLVDPFAVALRECS